MVRQRSYLILAATTILALSLLVIVENASAQTTSTKPAIPEFTVKYSDYSYDVAPVYGVDPNTDETVVTVPGYYVNNRTVEFTIKNSPSRHTRTSQVDKPSTCSIT